jgi:hypothetical protein
MSLRKGTFLATPTEWAVNNSKNNLPQFVCKFGLDAEHDKGDGQYYDCAAELLEVTGYFNLIYNDRDSGQAVRNEINIKQLEAALGWTDRNMQTLNDSDWSHTQVQLVLEEDEYNGKTSIKVKYLNNKDYQGGGGIDKADPESLKKMSQAFGALLKAGNAPAARPVSNPARKPAAAAPGNPCDEAKKAAWDAFKKQAGPDGTAEDLANAWRKAIADYFAKPANALGAAQWREFLANSFAKPAEVSPVSDEQQFKEDDIPF